MKKSLGLVTVLFAGALLGSIGGIGSPTACQAQDMEEIQPAPEQPKIEQLQPDKGKPYKEENPGAQDGGQFIGLVEWSVDQAQTWHPGSGPDAKPIPPVPSHYTIGFRVKKGNPDAEWPVEPEFRPSWWLTSFGEKSRDLGGEEIWVGYEKQAPEAQWNGTVTVECGNRITLFVPRVTTDGIE